MEVINCGSHRRGPSVTRRTKIIIIVIIIVVILERDFVFIGTKRNLSWHIMYMYIIYKHTYAADKLEIFSNQLKLMSEFII